MIDLEISTRTLDEFTQNTDDFLKRLEETGDPIVLTVHGEAKLVVQDAAAYQRLLDWVDRLEAIDGIRRGLRDVKQGRTQPADEALEEIRQKYNIPRDA